MSRARNRADGDFGDLDITNIGAVSLDSIKGDADGNTSLAFSGSDVITITTGGTTAMTINGSQNTVLAGTLTAVTSIGIGSAVLTEAELEFLDGITAGAGAASKVLVLDSSADVASGLRNLTASGTLQGTTITATTAFVPDASDGAALGTTALEFSDLFLADGAVISLGDDDDVTLTHVADTGVLINGASVIQFRDSALNIGSSADGQLDIAADTEVEITTALVEISADATIGDDLTLKSDAAVLGFGADTDVTLTHVADTGILFDTTSVIQFRDSAINIGSPADGDLDINADDEIELNSTLIDINGNVEISGTLAQVGVATFTARDIHSGGITIANDGQIGSVGDADSIAISSAGVTTFSQKDIHSIGMSVKNGATSAGFVEFFEDSDNGSNKVTLIGPASTADVTVTLPAAAGTLATTASAADEATALAIALG